MKIISLNARIWTRDRDKSSPYYWKTRMKAMKEMINAVEPDVICFQEMIFPATTYIPKTYKKVGLSFHHHIYVKKGITTRNHIFKKRTEKVKCFLENKWWTIINVHSSWIPEIHKKTMHIVDKWIKESNEATIACGDFNNQIDSNSTPITFEKYDGSSKGHIDYFITSLSSNKYKEFIITAKFGAKRISDHYPILLTTL